MVLLQGHLICLCGMEEMFIVSTVSGTAVRFQQRIKESDYSRNALDPRTILLEYEKLNEGDNKLFAHSNIVFYVLTRRQRSFYKRRVHTELMLRKISTAATYQYNTFMTQRMTKMDQ